MSFITRIPLLLALFSFTLSALAANSILPTSASSSFPQCGLTCTTLTNAQNSCEAGDASSWTSCFCQSSLLTGLKSSGSICSSCSDADQATLSTWYNNYCDPGKNTDATKSASSTATSTDSGANSTKSASKSVSATEEHKSWWSSHYRWVIMLIVLVVGFSIIAVVGVWLKRRHDAKRPHLYHGSSSMLSTASQSVRDSAWGSVPPQTRGYGPGSEANSSRSTMAKSSTPVPGTRTRLTKMEPGVGDLETR